MANVGDIEAVLCRHGEALMITRKFITVADHDECQRIYKSDGIITEVKESIFDEFLVSVILNLITISILLLL